MKVKNADTSSPNTWTWLKTMLCIGQVLSEARSMMNLIKSYGKLDVVYSFPSSAIPPDVGKKETGRASVKAPSPTPSAATRSLTTTVRTPGSYIPTQHGLAVRASMEVPLVQVFRACHSCGSKTHLLGECPVLYYSDSNTDHQAEWEGSTVGMAWAAVGFTEWQQKLVPSGYEDRVQYFLRGTKPYMMDNDTKRAKNSHGSSNNPSSSDDSDRSNQGQGGITRTRVTKVTKEVVEISRGGDTTPMRTKTRVVDPMVGVTDTTPHRKTSLLLSPVQVKIKVRTFVLMTWLLSSTMISII